MTGAPFDNRPGRLFAQLALPVFFAMAATAGALVIRVQDQSRHLASPSVSGPGTANIVGLRDGQTLVAAKGTVGREIVDWLASRRPGRRYFELGGQQFVGDTTEPTAESRARLGRLVSMLRANRDVSVRVIGYSDDSGRPPEDQQRSEARARRLVDEIASRGNAARRLAFEGRGAADPIASNAFADGRARNRRVAILMTRHGA